VDGLQSGGAPAQSADARSLPVPAELSLDLQMATMLTTEVLKIAVLRTPRDYATHCPLKDGCAASVCGVAIAPTGLYFTTSTASGNPI
jgi:hypothetical protein